MQRSMQRILAMHTDSLPRPDDLLEMFMAREQGRVHDMAAFSRASAKPSASASASSGTSA
jgi:hypothetical protein